MPRKKLHEGSGAENAKEWDWEESLKAAVRIGLKPREYDDISPAELNLMIEVYNEKQDQEFKSMVIQAYYTAALQRAKKMPKLDKLLKDIDKAKGKKKRRMSAEEMLEVVKGLNAAFGGD